MVGNILWERSKSQCKAGACLRFMQLLLVNAGEIHLSAYTSSYILFNPQKFVFLFTCFKVYVHSFSKVVNNNPKRWKVQLKVWARILHLKLLSLSRRITPTDISVKLKSRFWRISSKFKKNSCLFQIKYSALQAKDKV